MTYDNFTIKAQEAIIKGQQEAGKLDQQQVDTVHLLKGIIAVSYTHLTLPTTPYV